MVAVCGWPGSLYLVTVRAKMSPIIIPVYSALVCSIILTSSIVLPTAFPDVSFDQILLVVQIPR
eukprot:2088920-Heterocapsa_arctica.AAC.1